MNINLSKFKKIKEDQHSATLQHPAGHQIKIAKHILSPQLKEQLEKLPAHFAEGGMSSMMAEATPEEEQNQMASMPAQPQPQAQPQPAPQAAPPPTVVINNTPAQPPAAQPVPVAEAASFQPEAQPAQMLPPASVSSQPQGDARFNPAIPSAGAQYSPQNDPYGARAYGDISKEGLQNQMQGLDEAAVAQGAQNQAVGAEHLRGAAQEQAELNKYNKINDHLRDQQNKFLQDYDNQHIDPNHYLNSLDTGQRISTGIGLLLGGMGGGLTGQANPVLGFLSQQIDRDIDAQKQEMGKKKNLLDANFKQFGNERDAVAMTKAMLQGIIANRIEGTALKTGNPLLLARAKQAKGQIEVQNNKLMAEIAGRQTLQSGEQAAQGTTQGTAAQANQIDPAKKIRLLTMTGQMSTQEADEARKQLQTYENMEHQKNNLLNAFDVVNENDTVLNRAAHLGFTPAKTKAARDPLLAQLVKDSEGRITPADLELIRPLFPAPGDADSTVQFKKQKMAQFLDQKLNFPILKAYNLVPGAHQNSRDQSGKSTVTERPAVLPK